jgi:diguanylate cyclase (GGDEF)-like protein
VKTLKPKHARTRRHHERLYEVMRTIRRLSELTDLPSLLDMVLKAAKKTMRAEASSLMLLDHASNELYFQEIRGGDEDVKEIRLRVGQGIAGRVAQTGKPLIVNDVAHCPYFYEGADRRTGFHTRQILCVPLKVRKNVIGVLEVLNKAEGGRFDREDLLLFSNFASHAATAIENARLYALAAYDGLTQLFTRGHFDGWYLSEFSRVVRYKRPLSLLLIDVDSFKGINDRYGHGAGDAALAGLGRLLRETLRGSDSAARYGGDELVAALTETPGDKALLVAERFRKAAQESRFQFQGKPIALTVSIGVASYRPGMSAEELLREADAALYQAKTTRNAAKLAPSTTPRAA